MFIELQPQRKRKKKRSLNYYPQSFPISLNSNYQSECINRLICCFYITDSRESAFVYAITAAGVVYVVTRACSMGTLPQCTCDQNARDMNTDGEWEWGGCGDNVEYGYRKSRDFMDARKRKRKGDLTTKIQLHNNEAGRMVSGFGNLICCLTCWLFFFYLPRGIFR